MTKLGYRKVCYINYAVCWGNGSNIHSKDAQILDRRIISYIKMFFIPGVVDLHLTQRRRKRKKSLPSRVCFPNSKLRTLPATHELVAQTTKNFAGATTTFFAHYSDESVQRCTESHIHWLKNSFKDICCIYSGKYWEDYLWKYFYLQRRNGAPYK